MFNYVTSPFKFIEKKALNSKNKIFRQIYKKIHSIMEIITPFVLRKIPLEKIFIQLYYYEKICGNNLKEKIKNLLKSFKNDLREEKTWIKIKYNFGDLFKEIEIIVEVLELKGDEEPKIIEKMLNEMNGNKNENLHKNEENKENDFLKVYEEISSELNEIIKSFKNNFGKEKAKVDWFNVKSCLGLKMEVSLKVF